MLFQGFYGRVTLPKRFSKKATIKIRAVVGPGRESCATKQNSSCFVFIKRFPMSFPLVFAIHGVGFSYGKGYFPCECWSVWVSFAPFFLFATFIFSYLGKSLLTFMCILHKLKFILHFLYNILPSKIIPRY